MATLRILTANLWNGGADPDALAELLEHHRVDVAAFQELAPEQVTAVERVLPHGRLEPHRAHLGMGIALRHPGEVRRLALPCRDARLVRLEPDHWPVGEAGLEILNVHIMGFHVWPWLESLRIRRAQLRGVLAYLEATPGHPRVLVGDLNATPGMGVHRQLRAHLDDAAALAARRARRRPAPTWGPLPGSPRLLRIDHVLCRAVRVHRVEVVTVPGADHSGVLAEVEPTPGVPARAGGAAALQAAATPSR